MTLPANSSHCAICKSSDGETVQTQSLALLGRDDTCVVAFSVCRNCGHLQQWPPVSPELMADHYRTFATYELFGDPERLRAAPPGRHAKRFLSLVRDVGFSPGCAYEIGCASGEMLHQFRQLGWQVRGCDPSPSAAAQAKAIFGIDVEIGSEETALSRQKNLDLILVCHVLEHLYDPAAAIARCHAALAPGGYLVLEVPCAIAPESLPPGWFTFEHLHYYQPAILERLLEDGGFEMVEMRIAMKAEHYPVVAVAARKVQRQTSPATAYKPDAAAAMARTYAAHDEHLWARTGEKLDHVHGPVFVYGAGIHTAQLLDHTGLARHHDIIGIADRDAKKWGQTLAGFPVISPKELISHPAQAPIIISSYVSEGAILRTLLDAGVRPGRLVPLYSELPA
jgi:SAM-dependent methyltransferase